MWPEFFENTILLTIAENTFHFPVIQGISGLNNIGVESYKIDMPLQKHIAMPLALCILY